jgi:hypothetical protein
MSELQQDPWITFAAAALSGLVQKHGAQVSNAAQDAAKAADAMMAEYRSRLEEEHHAYDEKTLKAWRKLSEP